MDIIKVFRRLFVRIVGFWQLPVPHLQVKEHLVGGCTEDIECDGEAEGLVDEGLDGGLASYQPFQTGGAGVVS